MASIIETIVSLVFALLIIYVGFTVIYAINPLLAFLFVIMALYAVARAIGR